MFCPKCGNEIAEGSAFCGKCGAPVGAQAGGSAPARSAQGAASDGAGAGAPAPKRNGAKIGAIAAVAVVAVVLVAGFATNWFGLAGVQPKEAVEVPAASEGADDSQSDSQNDSQEATVKSAVEAYTWDELSQISAEIGAAGDEAAAIEVAKRYNLCTPEGKLDGTQVKSVTLADGTQTTVQIVGFAHDDKTSGGKAGITFVFGDAISEGSMNPSDANAGGWEASQMRAYLNGDGMSMLPEDLASVIVPVDKLTNNVGQTSDSSSVSVTSDSLWLFSAVELVGSFDESDFSGGYGFMSDVYNAEGSQYQLFEDMGIVYMDEEGAPILQRAYRGEGCDWYGRSPRPDSSDDFLWISYYGNVGYTTMIGFGTVPSFCI